MSHATSDTRKQDGADNGVGSTGGSPLPRSAAVVGIIMAVVAIWLAYQLFDTLAPEVLVTATVVSKEAEEVRGKFRHTEWRVNVRLESGRTETWLVNFREWKPLHAGDTITRTERAIMANHGLGPSVGDKDI